MKPYTLLIIGILIFTSCSKNLPGSETPTMHETIDVDINEDGFVDFNINYTGVDIDPFSITDGTYGLIGRLQPIGSNEILRHTEEGFLFLRNLEEVEENVIEPLKWRSTFSSTLVSITTINPEGDWPSRWEVNSEIEYSTYFIGLKLVTDSEIQLTWIEVEINTSNGMVSILNKGIL